MFAAFSFVILGNGSIIQSELSTESIAFDERLVPDRHMAQPAVTSLDLLQMHCGPRLLGLKIILRSNSLPVQVRVHISDAWVQQLIHTRVRLMPAVE